MKIFRRILLAGLVVAAPIGSLTFFYAKGDTAAIVAFDSCVGLLIWSIVFLRVEPLLSRIALATILACIFISLGVFFAIQRD
jgi:hypothetical protein